MKIEKKAFITVFHVSTCSISPDDKQGEGPTAESPTMEIINCSAPTFVTTVL